MMETEFQSVLKDHQGIIARMCRSFADGHEDYQDYMQEVAIQLWKAYPSFRGDSKTSTWVYRIALNVCLGQKRKRRVTTTQMEDYQHPSFEDNSMEQQEELEALQRAVKSLSEVDRAIILLYLEERPYKEIGEIMGISVTHVGVKVNRIKQKLKEKLHGG